MQIKTKTMEQILNHPLTRRIERNIIYFVSDVPMSNPWYNSEFLKRVIDNVQLSTQSCFKYYCLNEGHFIPEYAVEEVYEN